MSKYTRGLLAVMLAVVLVLPAAAFAMLPEANARSSTGMDGPAMTGKTVVDYDTSNHWKFWAGGYDGKEVTTQNVGRIWTDKTVKAVESGDSDFLTTLSAISSTSDTTISGKPLDIVMVLDASGSMKADMSGKDETKRIDALKKAANSFIDTIATQNQSITDESKQHQVAIVKFAGTKSTDVGNGKDRYGYNYSQTMKKLTLCKGEDAESLKSTIDSISPAGATRADYGLQLAEGISSDRADAKKVVVFFTDGSPTSWDEFENEVANDAINSAKKIKDKGADIYTIGIFSGVNPSANPTADGTSKENKFMHAVSSNYPAASSSISSWDEWTINFGARAENANYYKSATSADELEKIFEEISGSIVQAGYPTEVHGGYGEHKSGYITFTDELGDFMQVDNFTSVVYNGTTFDKPTKKTEGNVDTYKFTGAAANLVITVQHTEEGKPQAGDIVTVKIPASLIPLRHFKITDGVLTVDDTEPIRVNYTSSVKRDALDNLFAPEKVAGLKGYIESNTITAENGSKIVNFYANKWNAGALGDTIANFEPADTNRYYYFQKQTPIYVDKNCTTPATGSLAAEGIYYYKDEFEAKGTDSKVEPRTAIIEFTGGHAAQFEGAIVRDASGNLSFSEGTARLAFIDELHTTKELVGGNPTGTAADVLNPKWNNTSAKSDATEVDVHLGNNGKISFNVTPATVDTKTSFGLTKVLEGRDWTDADEFKFELSATSENDAPMPASTTAIVRKAAPDDKGKAAINFGEITYNKPGEYTYEVREVKGDAGGITYSKNVATFKVTVAVKATGGLKADVEKISGETEFKNTYSAKTETPLTLEATKKLTGRPMADDEFKFALSYAEHDEVLLDATNKGGKVEFGPLTYTTESLAKLVEEEKASFDDSSDKPTWTIRYTAAEQTGKLPAGVSATVSAIDACVTVVDNGDGTLTATAVYGDAGNEFVNTYTAAPVEASLVGKKNLQVPYGLTPADITGKFTFTVTGEEGAPMPANASVTNDAKGKVDFGKITFTLDDLNKALGKKPEKREHTFTYTVTESGEVAGVTNDDNATRKVSYTVTDDGKGNLRVSSKSDGNAAFTFTNTYGVAPTDSSVTDQVKTVKRLTGRDLAAGEFTFELLEDDVVVANGTNDANGNVTLSPIRYEAPGTHTYTLREACPNALGLYKGVTYDGATYTVVTTVSDNGEGTLTATHKLEGTTESAGFTNKYHAMPTQVSIGAIKVLEGRELKKDEFSFKLVGEDIESTVTNDADGKINFDKFEYDEPGTHAYTISEVKGDEVGMTYDKSVFTVTVNVVDDGEGNLKANVAFTKGDKSVEGIVFNNTYKKPETPVPTPDPGTPKTVTNIVKTVKGFLPTTGDQQATALLMAFVIAMAGVGALVWGIRKR